MMMSRLFCFRCCSNAAKRRYHRAARGLHGGNFIDGVVERDPEDGCLTRAVSSRKGGGPLPTAFAEASAGQVDRAMAAAERAAAQLDATDSAHRAAFLRAVADNIDVMAGNADFVERAMEETGSVIQLQLA